MTIKSPITGLDNISLVDKIEVKSLVKKWRTDFSIDISNLFSDECSEIFLYKCSDTNLLFYYPFSIVGSEDLYSQLQEFDWYYMPRKWEHDVAIQDLQGCKNILEVGCGQGAFVERLVKEHSLNAVGIEFNTKAIKFAKDRGISVFDLTLQEMIKVKAGYFDAVCTFQVLEHVADPLTFLKEMIEMLHSDGQLIISVPNSQSFLKDAKNNLLDQPPHHMHRWCQETFISLQQVLPIDLVKFRIEPLAAYHVDWYLGIQNSRLPNIRLIRRLAFRLSKYTLAPILKKSSLLRDLITGHTLYAEFRVRS
jgi:SAM-dependent methyltransferase